MPLSRRCWTITLTSHMSKRNETPGTGDLEGLRRRPRHTMTEMIEGQTPLPSKRDETPVVLPLLYGAANAGGGRATDQALEAI
jgi:hypothetical protein